MATRTWIYEKGTTSGGGTVPVPPDAPPVVIDIANVKVREEYNGKFEITIPYTVGAGAPTVGVGVFLEDPDISEVAELPMDGSKSMDGTSQVSGKWAPKHITDDFESPVVIEVAGQPKARNIRIYLQAFASVKNATLVRNNQPSPTPNVQVSIPAAAGEYVSGQEYAWLVTGASVTVVNEFENPSGPQYHLEFGYTAPDPTIPLPPGLRAFGGVMTVYEYDDGTQKEAMFLDRDKPQDWHSNLYEAGNGGHFKVWFCSRDVDGRRNSIVKGVTPVVDVTIVYPPAGQPSAPYVTAFALTNPRHTTEPDGTIYARADLAWAAPTSPRFSEVQIYRTGVTPPRKFGSRGPAIQKMTLEVIDWPKVAEAWTLIAISVDIFGKQSDDPANPGVNCPRVTWNIGPPGTGGAGSENTTGQAGISGVTITTEQELNNDGVVMIRHKITGWTNSTVNSFGGVSIARVYASDLTKAIYWDAAKDATTLMTDWEPAPTARTWDFYFVSRDMQGKRNTIVNGFTPKVVHSYTPIANNIIPSRLPAGWWDPAEFQWPAYPGGYFQALSFVAKKIFVGSVLRVGGGTGVYDASFGAQSNGQIAVYNSANVLRGWIGQQDSVGTPDNVLGHSVYGAWFTELYVGGDSPVNAPLYATQAGVVIVGGFDVQGSRYPYISIRDATGVECGRMGAKVGQGQVGPESTIQGAWFKEFAYGGDNFANWRMLAKIDASNPKGTIVQMRDINKFTIDYIQNYPNAGNPTNAAMHLEYGYDAFKADVDGNTSYWKFPGLQLYRSGTTHGINLINRGLVLRGPGSQKIGSFVSFNGDSFGSDSPDAWWGVLTMNSRTSGGINVELGSGGAAHGASYFTLRDGGGFTNFSVDTGGNVYIRGTLGLSSLSLSGTLQVSGTSTLGQVNCSGLTVNPNDLNCRTITTNGQPIYCGNINAAGYRMDVSTIVATSTIGASGFNPTGYAGATYNVSLKDSLGGFVTIWLNGTNFGAVQLQFRGGVFTGIL